MHTKFFITSFSQMLSLNICQKIDVYLHFGYQLCKNEKEGISDGCGSIQWQYKKIQISVCVHVRSYTEAALKIVSNKKRTNPKLTKVKEKLDMGCVGGYCKYLDVLILIFR